MQIDKCVENSNKIYEKWIQPIITKVLINTRWRPNQLVDANMVNIVNEDYEQ